MHTHKYFSNTAPLLEIGNSIKDHKTLQCTFVFVVTMAKRVVIC